MNRNIASSGASAESIRNLALKRNVQSVKIHHTDESLQEEAKLDNSLFIIVDSDTEMAMFGEEAKSWS